MHNPFFHRCLNVSRSSLTLQTNTRNSMESPASDRLETSSTQFYGVWGLTGVGAFLDTLLDSGLPVTISLAYPGIATLSSLAWHGYAPTSPSLTLTSVSFSDLLPYEQRTVVHLERNFRTGGVVYLRLPVLELPQQNVLARMTLLVSSEQSGVAVTALRCSLY